MRRLLLGLPVLWLLLLGLLLLTGCPPPPPPDEGSGLGPGPGEKMAAKRTEYRFPLPDDARSLDPKKITDTISDSVARRMFNTLVHFDADGKIQPDLAESFSVSEDGLTYSFKLRQARFHNGDPVTAQDVAFSFKRLVDPADPSPRANLLFYIQGAKDRFERKAEDVSGITTPDESTIEIKLNAPYAPFLNVLCTSPFSIVPMKAVSAAPDNFGDNPVGTGPFVFAEWQKDDRIVLRRNKDYFGTTATIETVIFRVLKDEKTRFENFKTGALEHCDLPPSQIKEVQADSQLSPLIQGVGAMDMYGYGFNCSVAPFKDNAALRLALNHAVDKQNIINNIWGGLVTEQKTYVPEGMFYFWADSPGYPYDVEKAKMLLEQAGYPGGQGLPELVLNIDLQPVNKLVAQAVQEDLRKLGVNVRIETTAWAPFLEKVYAGEAQFHQNTWLTDYVDPDNWLYQLLHSENFGDGGNITRWNNSEFDTLVKQAQVERDETRRAELYKQAEQIVHAEAPWLLLFWRNNSTLVQPWVSGLKLSRIERTPQLNNVPLEQVTLSGE